MNAPPDGKPNPARTAAIWCFVAVLAWAPFPLGGAVSWGAGFQALLIALCWVLWALSTREHPEEVWRNLLIAGVPLGLGLAVLLWAFVQTLPIVPPSWAHPIWAMASGVTGHAVPLVISLDPWRTDGEILKLLTYMAACWLAFSFARKAETASLLLNAVIAIGAIYAVYAFLLALLGTNQARLFYAVPVRLDYISGPFMLHNSLATYCGLCTVAAMARLFERGSPSIVARHGIRRLALTIVQFASGRGAPFLLAMLLSFGGVIASASRAGFAATLCGLAALGVVSLLTMRRGKARAWAVAAALAIILPLLFLIVANGDVLGDRLKDLLDAGTADNVRLALWAAANRMIADAPLTGLGLGTFQDAYPLYAAQVFPYIMDKGHCDYLEFAAGIGLPAAIAWWCALAWLFFLCLRGVRIRQRNRLYSLVAIGASVLVAVHSSVDFSLQMPAVGLLYATLLGIGTGQALPTRAVA